LTAQNVLAQPLSHSNFSPEDLHHFHRALSGSLEVLSHMDLLVWLQGDMQHYLPHDMLIVVWGDFNKGNLRHDVVTALPGVRSFNSDAKDVNALVTRWYGIWIANGRRPTSLDPSDRMPSSNGSEQKTALYATLQTMRSALVHGMVDKRSAQDCLYVTLSGNSTAADKGRSAMARVLPYLDTALRQVSHLPHQLPEPAESEQQAQARLVRDFGLSERELEVLQWVAAGKTNPEIGSILDLSEFTIKNHLKRIFAKLDVLNRAQAVGRFQSLVRNV
jgi:transcriptional regulator EpsA